MSILQWNIECDWRYSKIEGENKFYHRWKDGDRSLNQGIYIYRRWKHTLHWIFGEDYFEIVQ